METAEVGRIYTAFVNSHGQLLYALDRDRIGILQKAKSISGSLPSMAIQKRNEINLNTQNKRRKNQETLQTLLKKDSKSIPDILVAAEYPTIGQAKSTAFFNDVEFPYIIPFLGKNIIVVEGEGEYTDNFVKSIMLSVLQQTAPGQLFVHVYNPEWKEAYSSFSALENYESITVSDNLRKLVDLLSEQIDSMDNLMQGRFSSLLDLRKKSMQPVGQLRMVVIASDDWMNDGMISQNMFRLIASGSRAGIGFLINVPSRSLNKIKSSNTIIFKQSNGILWKSSHMPDIEVKATEWNIDKTDELLNCIKTKSEEMSVVTIPFYSIENTENMWTESSADGITFSLGRAGLDTITLRMGDEATQLNNALITGAPGKGKSNLLEVMIHSLCCRYSPDELELYLLDFKDGLTFKPYGDKKQHAWMPHAAVLGLESARDFGVSVLEYIEDERANRAKLMKKVNAGSLSQYRKTKPKDRMPRIVIVIDEYQKLVEFSDTTGIRAGELIENIVRQGRACGIHLILASQTVATGGGLNGKDGSIYASIPIRIALQNNIQESYATFVNGNDGAAKLRVRGEAVMNVNYGALDSNIRFTVAYAEPNSMLNLRRKWCFHTLGKNRVPKSFGTNDYFSLPQSLHIISSWRHAVEESNVVPRLLCGQSLNVQRDILSVPFGSDAGRHLVLLGNGDGESEPGQVPVNYAVGAMQGMAISLALQHPEGNARFIMIDGLPEMVKERNQISRWLKAMERLGFPVLLISPKDAPSFFAQLVEEAKSVDEILESCYILGFGMDRCSNMKESFTVKSNKQSSEESIIDMGLLPDNDPFKLQSSLGKVCFEEQTTGADQLEELLKRGPTSGIHLLGWWNNIKTFYDHTGIFGRDYIEIKMLLRTGANGAKDVLSTYTTWEGEENRMLVHDDTNLGNDMIVMPMQPLAALDVGKLEAMLW